MQKFTTVQKNTTPEEEPKVVHDGDIVKVLKYKNWDITKEKDMVIVLPYLPEEGYILLRHEYVPTYQWAHREEFKSATNFISVISGCIEEGESPKQALLRELREEAGIVLSSMKELEIERPLHVSKGSLTSYYPCLLELRYNDFKQVAAIGDGSRDEKLSKTIKVSLGDIDQIRCFDLITEYMIQKLKQEYKIK
jgi:8-oxo-dGTP pyrophosphatase MutT (NUDIX family)